ncbi:hypothetical protein RN001_006806 [Aquatica leii]|uniref:Glucosidase II subunit alpha n=1 Tax=Aquatica leii TaxID=1421715 RepID=A0AAN7SIT0_9COLE|nr:hypothetical protein RN001_006806 [Aquatica leii]
MITKLLLVLLVATEISQVVSWKRCDETFCNTVRKSPEGIEQRYYVESTSLVDKTVKAILKTDKPLGAPKLVLSINVYDNEIVHMFIDEDGTQTKRFRPTIALNNNLTQSSIILDDQSTVANGQAGIIRFEMTKNPFNVKIFYGERLFSEINPKNNFVFESLNNKVIAMGVTLHEVERAYGLPEHAEHLALKSTIKTGDPYRHFNVDYGHYQLESRESLYGTIGVLYGHGTKHSCGVFWLNAAQTWIDLETAPNNMEAFFMSESGVVDLFVLPGPTLPEAVQQYAKLTGTAPLPQYFALGYHQSRYSYMTQDEVLNVVNNFESHNMPVDVLWLDIDYTDQKMYFTWDPERFSSPQTLIDTLEATNRKLVAIIDPHIKVQQGYMVHDEATKQKYYVKAKDSQTAFEGECWPGLSSYLDFLNPDALEYYSSLYSQYYFNNTNVHLWNDMNEPAVFNAGADENTMPLSAVHYGGWEHRDVHNIYGFYQTVGTKKGMLSSKPDLRPFILTRSHFAGIQRYAAVWTGDNAATWKYLQMSFPMCLTEALAGVSFCGADVGGFFEIPEDQLYQRWYQAGAWLPFYRGHSTIDVPRREPYLFNDYVQHRVRTALFQRYAHMPVWYTTFYEHEITGEPVIRPITYHYPQDADALSIENEILLGKNILAAPVLEQGVVEYKIYLPGGQEEIWFNIDEDYKRYYGIGYQLISVTLDSVPIFYRSGSIITRKDVQRLTSVDTHQDPFALYICLDDSRNAEGRLYVDDYYSFSYTQNEFLYVNFSFSNNTLSFNHISNTKYAKAAKVSEIIFVNSKSYPVSAVHIIDGKSKILSATFAEGKHTYVVKDFNVSLDEPSTIEFTFKDSSLQ